MRKLKKFLLFTGLATLACSTLASCNNSETQNQKITLYFGGSTSVEKIAKELTANFALECPRFEAVHNHTGSGDAYKGTQGSEKNGANKLDIGFLSRELNSSETCIENTSGLICKDGIVAVVNKANDLVDDVNADILKQIYSSGSIKWSDVSNSSSSFDASKSINKYSRDSTSGTRDGFFTTIGYSEAKTDDTKLPGVSITSSNGDMITKVLNDPYGIGYISLSSLESSNLKGLKYEGVPATESGVIDGTYKLQRNFNYCTRSQADCNEEEWLMIQAFIAYMYSQEGLAIIKSKDGILTQSISSAKSWETIKQENPDYSKICSK